MIDVKLTTMPSAKMIVVLFLIGIVGGALVYKIATKTDGNLSSITTEPLPTPTPSPSIPFFGGGDNFPSDSEPSSSTSTLDLDLLEPDGETLLTSIDWGFVSLGEPGKTRSLYLDNKGTLNATIVSAVISNLVVKDENATILSGDFGQYFILTLDRQGEEVACQEKILGNLKLVISDEIVEASEDITTFTFDITVYFSQA
jgi:hypothetical protein